MTSPNMIDALNKHLNAELYASYLYLSLSAYYETVGLRGFAHWMRLQAQEEIGHAMRFYNFINDREGRVVLASIDAPPTDWPSPLAGFEAAYQHEKKVSKLIDDLVDIAIQERDHSANTFLQWFVNEQVEEEATAKEIIDKIEMVENDRSGLFLIDQQLGARSMSQESGD